jgi:ribosome maturation factor RimP
MLLPIEDMAEAKLTLSDALIAESLKRGKAAERAQREGAAGDAEGIAGGKAKPWQDKRRRRGAAAPDFRPNGSDRRAAQHEGD